MTAKCAGQAWHPILLCNSGKCGVYLRHEARRRSHGTLPTCGRQGDWRPGHAAPITPPGDLRTLGSIRGVQQWLGTRRTACHDTHVGWRRILDPSIVCTSPMERSASLSARDALHGRGLWPKFTLACHVPMTNSSGDADYFEPVAVNLTGNLFLVSASSLFME